MERSKFLDMLCSFTLLLFVHVVQGKSFKDEEINRQLKVLNKPAIKTIKVSFLQLAYGELHLLLVLIFARAKY